MPKKLEIKNRVAYLIDISGIIRFVQKGVPENQDFFNKLKRLN